MKNLIKILTALAAIAGVIYVIATYGEQIVAWCKKIWSMVPKCPCCEEAETVEEFTEEAAPEIVVSENEPVAAEEDFAE